MKRFLISILVLGLFFPSQIFALGIQDVISKAGGNVPFGGFSVVVIPCTCSTGIWVQFTPFFVGSLRLPVGALTYRPPITKTYAYGTAGVPSAWHLGTFIPTPGTCWVGVPPFCAPLLDLGVMKMVGSGMPAGL